MAVTMVIGNAPKISLSLLCSRLHHASVIANEFAEATSKLHSSALMEIGLILLVVTLIINALARLLIWSVSQGCRRRCGMMHSVAFRKGERIHLMTVLMLAATAAVLIPLGLIFYHIVKMGLSSLNLDFFTQIPKPTGETGGGMANGMAGSLLMIAMASLIGLPIGIFGAIYLAEYGGSKVSHRDTLLGRCPFRDARPSSPGWSPTPCWSLPMKGFSRLGRRCGSPP